MEAILNWMKAHLNAYSCIWPQQKQYWNRVSMHQPSQDKSHKPRAPLLAWCWLVPRQGVQYKVAIKLRTILLFPQCSCATATFCCSSQASGLSLLPPALTTTPATTCLAPLSMGAVLNLVATCCGNGAPFIGLIHEVPSCCSTSNRQQHSSCCPSIFSFSSSSTQASS